MAWLYLILAGLFEMGWPLGFKLANLCPRYHFLFLALSVVSMGVSGWLLYVAQRTIPMGTAYMIGPVSGAWEPCSSASFSSTTP